MMRKKKQSLVWFINNIINLRMKSLIYLLHIVSFFIFVNAQYCSNGQIYCSNYNTCFSCYIGTYYINGLYNYNTCPTCPVGLYNNMTGMSICYPCPAGSYYTTSTYTNPCGYSNTYALCNPCPAGNIIIN